MATDCPKCRFDNAPDSKFCKECGTQLMPVAGVRTSKTLTLETPAEGLARGTLFAGRYEIIEELGTGGMGSVFRAEDTEIRQEVALKLIRPEIASSRSTIERFRNEIKTARMISHRNVCRMFDLGEEKGAYFITMEYVSGEDMKSFLRRAAPLSPGRAISIGKQICEGLAEAHRLGVVHRDLKPGNIMIDKEGNARIMDFGIARSIAEKGITGTGIMIGTPEYMSPEQAEGKEADQRSDIYSLGVILYEMVTGRIPFEGETALSIAQKHRYEPPLDPRKINPQISEDVSRLILRCLEKDREARYQTAAELLAGLEAALPVSERPAPGRPSTKHKPAPSKTITVSFTPKKLLIPALASGAVIIAALFGWRLFFNKAPAAAPKIDHSIAVISLRNQTGDTAYDYLCQRSIPDLLITKLENSGNFYVATWERMLDLLKQMGKRDVQVIDDELGFEICRREGIRFLVSGSLNKAGETFMADVKILDAETRGILKGAQSRGRGEDSILDTQIDQLSREICSGLGIGGDRAPAASLRIADMTTSSIEAYNHYLRGMDYIYQYKFNDARASFDKALQIDPSFASAHSRLAYVLRSTGEAEASRKAMEQARALSDRVSEKERLYIRAQEQLTTGGYDPAVISALEEFVRIHPREKEAHHLLGMLLWGLPDLDGTIREFEIIVELDPSFSEAYNALAILYFLLGKFEKSFEYAIKYASLLPDSANPLDTLGGYYLFRGDLDKAIEFFGKAVQKDPDSLPGSLWSMSYVLALKEDYPEAMNRINRLLERDLAQGIRADALAFRGFLRLWLGRTGQSISDFDGAAVLYRSVGDETKTWFAIYCKAIAYGEQGEYKLSQKYLKSAYDFYMDHVEGQAVFTKAELVYNLAWNALQQGRMDLAKIGLKEIKASLPGLAIADNSMVREEYGVGLKEKMEYLGSLLEGEISIREGSSDINKMARAFGNDPDFLSRFSNTWLILQLIDYLNFPPPFVRDLVPRAYLEKGELGKAIGAYERLATFNPKSRDRRLIHPLVHYRLAKVYEQAGQKDRAAARYKRFLDLWKDADAGRSEVEDAKKRLADLTGS